MTKIISIIIPCYNEAAVLDTLFSELAELANRNKEYEFEFVCVDDGSQDSTLSHLKEWAERDKRAVIVEFSRNFGKEPALSAGIDYASGDAVIPFDADLQDPPEVIDEMIIEWEKGAEVVLAKRKDRSVDSPLKRMTANGFYRVHNAITSVKIPDNVGDFRLMDRVVVDALKQMPERMRFMKGIFAWVGFSTVTVEYVRAKRAAGETKFSGWKLWNFAIEGVTSFSIFPLKIWSYIGGVVAALCCVYGFYILTRTIVFGVDLPGYASLLLSILFLGSINLIGIGILGEYVGRIYFEVKGRPIYIVKNIHGQSDSDE